MKSYTDIEQSKKLAEILPLDSADMFYSDIFIDEKHKYNFHYLETYGFKSFEDTKQKESKHLSFLPCWSLAALLEYINRNFYKISLNYCGLKYTISFDDGERYKAISKDYSIDAAFEIVCWLKENGKI